MRSTPFRFALAAVVAALAVGIAPAQFGFAPRAKIDKIRVGFGSAGENSKDESGNRTPVSKVGMWAPVSVGIEFLNVKGYRKGIMLEVVTSDCDDLQTLARYPIVLSLGDTIDPESDEFLIRRGPGMRVEPEEMACTAYVKLPSDVAEVRLRLVEEETPDRALSETVIADRERCRPRDSSKYVILCLGGKLPGLEFNRKEVYTSRVEQAHIDSVQEMPDQWFGYEAADLVVLPTGGPSAEFIASLFNSTDPTTARKRRALFEWVRRGGKLVVSVADRTAEVAASPEFTGYVDATSPTKGWVPGVLPVQVVSAPKVETLQIDRTKTEGGVGRVGSSLNPLKLDSPGRPFTTEEKRTAFPALFSAVMKGSDIPEKRPPNLFPVATLKENQKKTPVFSLLTGNADKRPNDNLIVQAPFGLGRVTVVAFDLDQSPFTDQVNANYRGEFWEWLVAEAGDPEASKLPDTALQNRQEENGFRQNSAENEDGIVAALRGSVDHYDEVPVISFGWVALFILGYTLIIGPVEYILLKKLFGKLELTWITFPIIVLTVSGAAYLTAYVVKGQDLRMNKIDVVDIDLRTDPARPRVYGRTWFTVFSPRIDSYTIGVEPKENWAKSSDDRGYSPVTTMDWFGLPNQQGSGATSRGYTYSIDPRGDSSPEANGLTGVPIQVWSTKAFAANWSGVADADNPPVTADLRQLPAGGLDGTINYNITLKDVEEAYLVYSGKVYTFEKVAVPGMPVQVSTADWSNPKPIESVFRNDSRFVYRDNSADGDFGGGWSGGAKQNAADVNAANKEPLNLWGMLFHQQASFRNRLQNGSFRPLDQSWRLSSANDREVMLLFKLKRASKQPAEQLMSDPDSPSPTRVWLHGLPGRDERKPADGIAQQDTYVRVYLPVKPAGSR